ncbi:lipocalin family protein [Profundibacter sp.]
MYRLIIALFFIVSACAPVIGYRDASARITSVALFDPALFAGEWVVVATYDPALCRVRADITPQGFDWVERNCNGDENHSLAPVTGPGRFTPKGGAHKGREHWVMWVDQTYRTAVIGSVDGRFAMVLNRDRHIPPDRMQAAREILDWNGYDLTRLILKP